MSRNKLKKVLIDVKGIFNKQEFIDNGLNANKKWLDRQVSKDKMNQQRADEIFGKMSGEISLEKAVSDVDLVIEAIIISPHAKSNVHIF